MTRSFKEDLFLPVHPLYFLMRGLCARLLERTVLRSDIDSAKRAASVLRLSLAGEKGAEELLSAYRSEALRDLLQIAVEHSPFYRDLLKGRRPTFDGLESMPLLTKEVVRQNSRAMVVRRIPRYRTFTFNTGGSTGSPLEFIASRRAGFVDRYHQELVLHRAGYSKGDRILACDGTPISFRMRKRGLFWRKKSFSELPYGSFHLSSHYLNDETAPRYIEFIKRFKPAFVRGYPSFIARLALYLHDFGEGESLNVKAVQLTAENIAPWQVEAVEAGFRCKVLRQYGHSEMAIFAFSNSGSSKYLCSPVYGHTEVLGADGRHVSEGEVGEIVVTGFHNYAMPFLRYRTGDLARYGGSWNGFVVLSELLGRQQDFVYERNGNPVPVTGIVFGQHFRCFRNIRRWQIVQETPGEILLRVSRNAGFGREDEEELIRRFETQVDLKVKIQITDEIALTSRGKWKFVDCRLEA